MRFSRADLERRSIADRQSILRIRTTTRTTAASRLISSASASPAQQRSPMSTAWTRAPVIRPGYGLLGRAGQVPAQLGRADRACGRRGLSKEHHLGPSRPDRQCVRLLLQLRFGLRGIGQVVEGYAKPISRWQRTCPWRSRSTSTWRVAETNYHNVNGTDRRPRAASTSPAGRSAWCRT